jgi:hypothetical protein
METKKFSKFEYLKNLSGAKMRGSEFRVLIMLLNYANKDGNEAWPGVAKLAEDSDLSERQVRRCLTALHDARWIREVKRGRRGPNGDKASEWSFPSTPGSTTIKPKPSGHGSPQDLPDKTEDLADTQVRPTGHSEQTYRTNSEETPGKLADTGTPPSVQGTVQHSSVHDQSTHTDARCHNCGDVIELTNGHYLGQRQNGQWTCIECGDSFATTREEAR